MSDQSLLAGSLTEEQVAVYLKDHPDFFCQRDDLLGELHIPHQRGDTISLVERQVTLLRERNHGLRNRISELVGIARDNDRLFDKTRRLTLALLEAKTLDQIADSVEDAMLHDFHIDYVALVLISNDKSQTRARVCQKELLDKHIEGLIDSSRIVCGRLRNDELRFLFPEHCLLVKSTAVAPLQYNQQQGLLALGSRTEQFRSNADTIFLTFIADTLARVLHPVLK